MERSGRSGSSARASVGRAARIVRSAVVSTIDKQPINERPATSRRRGASLLHQHVARRRLHPTELAA